MCATDLIVAGDFNESVSSENMKNFVNETGSCDVFAETNGVEIENREATCQHGRKCIDCVIATEGTLWNVTGIEIFGCSEIVESDHRGCLTDVDFQSVSLKSSLKQT